MLTDIEGRRWAMGNRAGESDGMVRGHMVDHRTTRRRGCCFKGVEVVAESHTHFQRRQHLPIPLRIEPKAILNGSRAERVPRCNDMTKVGSHVQFQRLKREKAVSRFKVIGVERSVLA